jgi:hypothetical protein
LRIALRRHKKFGHVRLSQQLGAAIGVDDVEAWGMISVRFDLGGRLQRGIACGIGKILYNLETPLYKRSIDI